MKHDTQYSQQSAVGSQQRSDPPQAESGVPIQSGSGTMEHWNKEQQHKTWY